MFMYVTRSRWIFWLAWLMFHTYINQFLFICQICTWQTHLLFFVGGYWWSGWVIKWTEVINLSLKKNWSRYILVLTTAVIFCLFRFCKLFISTILDNHIRTMYKCLLFCPISTTCPELWIYPSIIFNPFFIKYF